MSPEKLVVVSADGHAGPERMADFMPYFEARHFDAFKEYAAAVEAYDAQRAGSLTSGGARSKGGEDGLWDFNLRTRHLDEDGISAEIIHIQGAPPFGTYPAVSTLGGPVQFKAQPDQIAAGCRAYNRWLSEKCATDPMRHLGVARLPIPDIEAAVAEVEFAAGAGLRGGVALPIFARGEAPFYNDGRYEPLWAACAHHGMAINFHGGANMDYGDGIERLALVLAETDWLGRRGMSHMIFAGVFERHPGLHVAITEQRTHWLDPVLKEWDSVYAFPRNADLRTVLPRRPSDYFRTNCFIGASFLSRPEVAARGELGNHTFMWGGDYPHEEGVWPYTKTALRWTFAEGVSSDDLRSMLSGNAARCYGIDLKALEPIADLVGPTEVELRTPVGEPPVAATPGERGAISWAYRREGPWH